MTKGAMMRKIVVLAFILALLVPAALLVGCGGGGSSSQAPEEAAKKFFAAYQNKDANTTWNLLSTNSTKAVKKADWESFLKESTDVKFTVGTVTVNGNEATAEVAGTVSGDTSTETVPLVKEDGVWKVDMASMSDSSTK